MKVWFEEFPKLLDNIIRELLDNGIETVINEELLAKGKVELKCQFSKNSFELELENDFELIISFPDSFPYFRPEAVAKGISLPRHQNLRTGNLCLIPRPSEYWNVGTSIFEYLKERLPLVIEKGKIVDQEIIAVDPDEQAEPVSEYFCEKTNVVVLSSRPSIFERVIPEQNAPFEILDSGNLELCISTNDRVTLFKTFNETENGCNYRPMIDLGGEVLKILVHQWSDKENNIISGNIGEFLEKNRSNVRTKWYQLSKFPSDFTKEGGFLKLICELNKFEVQKPKRINIRTKDYKIENIVGLVFPEEVESGQIGWGWCFMINGVITRLMGKKEKIDYSMNLPVFSLDQKDYSKRIPKSESVIGKTISIVGLGSIGAPSVLEFAKNRVSKLKIMDFDVVGSSSSVRWPLGLKYVGEHKAVALKKFITENFPHVKVEIYDHKIGSIDYQSNEMEIINDFIKDSSLVYDASAEEGVNHFLSRICRSEKIPYIMVEGRRGAWGGVVLRVLPSENNLCWMCYRHYLNDSIITKPKQDEMGEVQTHGCGDITFTGASYDLQNISLAGVRLAVNTLDPIKNDLNWDVAVLSMVDEENNDIYPTWKEYKLEVNPKCPYCGH